MPYEASNPEHDQESIGGSRSFNESQIHRTYGSSFHNEQQSVQNESTMQHSRNGSYRTANPLQNRLLDEMDVPYEIFAVRKSALKVLEPLTHTWVLMSMGFAITSGLMISRILHILPTLPYWIIFTPSWISHFLLLLSHLKAGRALSTFITEANENRQRPDSTDHIDRTEYLPLLQRSLKFGLKTGTLCFLFLLFEILLYLNLTKQSVSIASVMIPVWIVVVGGILDAIICKTQNLFKLMSWILAFVTMLMVVLKEDYGFTDIEWTTIGFPLGLLLTAALSSLIYVLYGHHLGYFQLTEHQLSAGVLYSIAIFLSLCLLAVTCEAIPGMNLTYEARFFIVILAPLTAGMVGLGAWGVSRDEYQRLLLLGGQQSVLPMRLKLEPAGWTCVESRGISTFPMFGEVCYEPLDSKEESIEMCLCCAVCSCYAYEDKEEEPDVENYYVEPSPPIQGALSSSGRSINRGRSLH